MGVFARLAEADSPGVLDVKWSGRIGSGGRAATADAHGCLQVYQVVHDASSQLRRIAATLPGPALALSLDWADRLGR